MKIYLIHILILVAFSSCIHEESEELMQARNKNDSLIKIVNEKDSSVNVALRSFNEIQNNLDYISNKQHLIVLNVTKNGEISKGAKEYINEEIEGINRMMELNRDKIVFLSNRLNAEHKKNIQIETIVEILKTKIAQKENELTILSEQLTSLNTEVSKLEIEVITLTAQNRQQARTIEQNSKALHTAFYIVGKSKDLEKRKLIDKNRGLFGVGGAAKMSNDFDPEKFVQIDNSQINTIAVNGENAKIITTHPPDSYYKITDEKDKDVLKSLVITDPEKFWNASKYLVVVTD